MEKSCVNILVLDGEHFLRATVIDTSLALEVKNIGGDFSAVRSKLVALYGEQTAVTADGGEKTLGALTAAKDIFVPARPDFSKPKYNIADAMRIISRLMQRPGGCPWDSVQTHESIRINMLEEAYEAVDAIDKRDLENMKEEFGDVLLQSLLQSEIAERDGEFCFDDVCDGLCKKLINRHTFIFGGDSAGSAEDAITLWEKNKAAEKHYTTPAEQLESLPAAFPGLLLAQKIHKKSKKAGLPVDAQKDFDEALAARDYAALIAACAELLCDGEKDAEVEVNAFLKNKIKRL